MVPAKGYLEEDFNLKEITQRLENHINKFPGNISKFSEEELQKRPSENKWSKKEILGHLIDSAINNLKRFTDIQFSPSPYVVTTYSQVDLVIVNRYNDLPLEHLLNLWTSLNNQIVYVIINMPPDKLELPVDPQYGGKELRSLIWIIGDYVAHMEHHFKQIFNH